MIKQVNMYEGTSNAEKRILYDMGNEIKSKKQEELLKKGGAIDQYCGECSNPDAQFRWREFVAIKGAEIEDRTGKKFQNAEFFGGVVVRHNPAAKEDALVAAYLAIQLLTELQKVTITEEERQALIRYYTAEEQKAEPEAVNRMQKVFYETRKKICGDFLQRSAGEFIGRFCWTVFFGQKVASDETGFWNCDIPELQNSPQFWDTHDTTYYGFFHSTTVIKIARVISQYLSSYRLQRCVKLTTAGAPMIILQNEYRVLVEQLFPVFAEILGATELFEHVFGYTPEGEFVADKENEEQREETDTEE